MPKPFKKLRDALKTAEPHEIRQIDVANYIAEKLNNTCCLSHISDLINARRPWGIDEAYTVLDLIGARPEQFHEYFPKGGYPDERI